MNRVFKTLIFFSSFLQHLTSSTPTTTTFIQTVGNPSSVGLSSSVFPSPTSSSTSNGTSSGIIIGGVIAAILGTAGILAAVVYFLVGLIQSGIIFAEVIIPEEMSRSRR